MFALICNAFAVTLCLLLPLFQFLLLPLFQLPLLPLIQNLGFGMASESARFFFTSLLTGGTFRPDPARPHLPYSGTPGLVVNINVDQSQFQFNFRAGWLSGPWPSCWQCVIFLRKHTESWQLNWTEELIYIMAGWPAGWLAGWLAW